MHRLATIAGALALVLSGTLAASPPIDINTASAEDLAAAISGVGVRKAQTIIEDRERNGPFRSVEELTRVPGIGDRTLERSRERLTVGSPAQ
jgi:competence protein ComEA